MEKDRKIFHVQLQRAVHETAVAQDALSRLELGVQQQEESTLAKLKAAQALAEQSTSQCIQLKESEQAAKAATLALKQELTRWKMENNAATDCADLKQPARPPSSTLASRYA